MEGFDIIGDAKGYLPSEVVSEWGENSEELWK